MTKDELKSAIMCAVRRAGKPLSEFNLAKECGQILSSERRTVSAPFAGALESLVSAGELKKLGAPWGNPCKITLGDKAAKTIAQLQPPVTTVVDPSLINPSLFDSKLDKTAAVEIVDIKLPASMQPLPMPAAAKTIAQPTAVATVQVPAAAAVPVVKAETAIDSVRADTGAVNDRLNAAWNQFIDEGQPFSRGAVCDRASVTRSMRGRDDLKKAMTVAVSVMASHDWAKAKMEEYRDLPQKHCPDVVVKPTRSLAKLRAEVAALQAENAELKARSSQGAAVARSPLEVLAEKVRALEVALNKRHSEALAHAAETQRMENERTALLTAIGVLKKEGV